MAHIWVPCYVALGQCCSTVRDWKARQTPPGFALGSFSRCSRLRVEWPPSCHSDGFLPRGWVLDSSLSITRLPGEAALETAGWSCYTWTGELWEARVFCSMGQKSRWSWSSKRQIRTKHMCRCREEERQHRVSCRCFRLGCNTCLAWLDSHPWVLWGVLNPYHKCQLFSHHPPQMGFWPPTYFNLLFLCHLRSQQGWMWKHIPWSL